MTPKRVHPFFSAFLSNLMIMTLALVAPAQEKSIETPPFRPQIVAHYMPWYSADPKQGKWGWHWTMNHFDPNQKSGGHRQIASHYDPLCGPYDSSDEDILEYHFLTMKLAGIDGVIIDWYGRKKHFDYLINHKNTLAIVRALTKVKLKFAICYEDQTIPALVKAGLIQKTERAEHAISELRWLANGWMKQSNYLTHGNVPVLLSFGQSGLTDAEWEACVAKLQADRDTKIAYFSEHRRRIRAIGAFDWPIPTAGILQTEKFLSKARGWKSFLPVAFPRFHDIYRQAGVHQGYERIHDDGGKTFRITLQRAITSKAPLIQIATWNDWGEGTQIEPSHQFGFRDLEVVQEFRYRSIGANRRPTKSDLTIPLQVLKRRRKGTTPKSSLDTLSQLIADHRWLDARQTAKRLGLND